MPILVVLLVDIVVFYTIFIHIKDTEKTMGTRTECRRIGRALGGHDSRFSCTYRYYVKDIEYNEADILKHIKRVPTGIETEIYYKKNAPTHIIAKSEITSLVEILSFANIAALCFSVFMQIMAL